MVNKMVITVCAGLTAFYTMVAYIHRGICFRATLVAMQI